MSEKDFREKAAEYGYTEEEILDFIELHKESGIKYEDFILEQRIID